MRVVTEELDFHGDIANGKGAVHSIDFQPQASDGLLRLATCGIDPVVRVWRWAPLPEGTPGTCLTLLAELGRSENKLMSAGHERSVNVVRWSPDGELLASGSDDGQVFLWRKAQRPTDLPESWSSAGRPLGAHSDVLDLCWSADGKVVYCATLSQITIAFSVETSRMVARLDGHKQRVQGVAADPLGMYVGTVAADRDLRVYSRTGKKAPWQMHHRPLHYHAKEEDEKERPEPRLLAETAFTYPYRRLAWSPDGAFLAVPSGCQTGENASFCTLLLHRQDLDVVGGVIPAKGPTVAVRFAPELEPAGANWVGAGHSRFAVATASAVTVYDTASLAPVGYMAGMHYDSIKDLAWSPDARCLAVANKDGSVSIAMFDADEVSAVAPRTPMKAGEKAAAESPAKEARKDSPRALPKASPKGTPLKSRDAGAHLGSLVHLGSLGNLGEASPGEGKPKKRRIPVEIVAPPKDAEIPKEAETPKEADTQEKPAEKEGTKRRRIAPVVCSVSA